MNLQAAKEELAALAIADFDLMWCERYLAGYLELLKKPEAAEDQWNSIEFIEFTGDFNVLDILARSLVTSIVISYARPWSNNKGVSGGRKKLPTTIFKSMKEVGEDRLEGRPLLPFDQTIHKRVLKARDEVVAHSDASQWNSLVDTTRYGTETSVADPFQYLSEADARKLLRNSQSLRSEIRYLRDVALRAVADASAAEAQQAEGADS